MLLAAHAAMAGSILDYIRNYDLNDYALGVAYSFGQKPYLDGGNSGFAYPYLTSFRHIAFTDDWLILSGGDVGARWVSDSGLILGGVGRIKTHGTGDTDVGDVLEIDVRKWTVEVAPLVGWRRWPVHFEYKHYWEVFNRHGGSTGELEASFPMEFDWGYLVPAAALIRNDATHNRYYYGVEETPLLPEREAYVPGASLNPKLSLEWGFAIREKWLLRGIQRGYLPGEGIRRRPLLTAEIRISGRDIPRLHRQQGHPAAGGRRPQRGNRRRRPVGDYREDRRMAGGRDMATG
jgi:hypothetical protein